MKGRMLVSSSSVSSGGKPRASVGERTCLGILITPKPWLLPPQCTADKQLTGTKEGNEGQTG